MNDVLDHTRLERRALLRHFLEMVGAMIAGMVVLGALVQMFSPAAPCSASRTC